MIFSYELSDIGIDGVYLRPLARYQADDIFQAIDRNRDHIKPWLSFPDYTNQVSDTEDWIEKTLSAIGKGSQLSFSIWHENKCIGMISFGTIKSDSRQAEIGYWLDQDFTGFGIVTTATEELIRYGFDQLNLNKVFIRAEINNHPSIAVSDRLGFHRDAKLRQDTLINDGLSDIYHFSMLADEWQDDQ